MAAQWNLSNSGGNTLWALSDAAPPAPSVPSGLAASATGGTTALLELTDTNSGLAGYRWQLAPVSTGVYVDAAGGANPSANGVAAFTATGLSPATQYQFRARAENGAGQSSYVVGPTFWTDNTGTGGGEVPLALSGGSQADVSVAAAGAGQAGETGSGGSSAVVEVSAAGGGQSNQAENYSGGASVQIEISAAGGGQAQEDGAPENYAGGSSVAVQVSAAGQGVAITGPGVAHRASEFKVVSGKRMIDKDPDATLDYEALDLAAWLSAMQDTLANAVVVGTPVSVEVLSCSLSGNSVVLGVRGGALGSVGSVTIRITTTGGRINDHTVYFNIRQN